MLLSASPQPTVHKSGILPALWYVRRKRTPDYTLSRPGIDIGHLLYCDLAVQQRLALAVDSEDQAAQNALQSPIWR
jgi:hypothetical protein